MIIIGDFDSQIGDGSMKEFCDTYNLSNLKKEPTCFKNAFSPTSIDMILTNRANYFYSTLPVV